MTKRTFYITKYAISEDIIEMEMDDEGDGYARGDNWRSFKIGTDAFTSREDAVKAAEAMRLKKIKSLRAQIAKLEGMRFE